MNLDEDDFLKDDYIYFDWNAIQDLKSKIYYKKDSDPEANKKWIEFKNIQKKFRTPLSHAHFDDLMNSTDPIEIQKDLYFLANEFCDGTLLVNIPKLRENVLTRFSKIKGVKTGYGVFEFYQDLINSNVSKEDKQEFKFKVSFPSIQVDTSKLKETSILNKYINDRGIFDSDSLEQLLSDCWENSDDVNFMNEFINSVREIKYYENAAHDYFPETQREEFKEMIIGLIKFSKISEKNIQEANKFLDKYIKFIGKDINQLSKLEKMFIAYHIINFTNPRGAFGENFNKRNKPINFYLDCTHYLLASKSKMLVTGDSNFTKKAKALNLLGFSKFDIKKLDEIFEDIVVT